MADKLLLRPAEAADAIGVSRARAYELIGNGTIPSIRLGGSIRVPVRQLQEWIDSRVTSPSAVA